MDSLDSWLTAAQVYERKIPKSLCSEIALDNRNLYANI